MISFVVHMEPRAKGRPRATSIGGVARQYTPAATRHWEHEFAARAEQHQPPEPLSGPLDLVAVFVFRRPMRLNRRRDPQGLIAHDRKPDIDNVLKSTLDSLACFFAMGDQQIARIHATKYYAERGGTPRIEITIKELSE